MPPSVLANRRESQTLDIAQLIFGQALSKFENRVNGQTTFIADDFRVDASFAARAINTNNSDFLVAEVQRGADRITGSAGGDAFRSYGGNDFIAGNGGSDLLIGDGGRDTISGGGGRDEINGGGGNDILSGNGGCDQLLSGGRRDRLEGGNGADRLIGGSGPDLLIGGAGADVFVFGVRDGSDEIADFQDGLDRIEIRDANRRADLSITQDDDDVLIGFRQTTIRVTDADAGDLTVEDFIF